jgi:hypothetical protein
MGKRIVNDKPEPFSNSKSSTDIIADVWPEKRDSGGIWGPADTAVPGIREWGV